MNSAIIVAAGRGERMGGDVDKIFLSLDSKPVLAYSLRAFQECSDIDSIVVVARKDQITATKGVCQMFGIGKLRDIVPGGATRQASVKAGLDAVDPDTRIVAVHDAARPCVRPALIADTVASAKKYGSGVAATQVTDTVKIVQKGQVVSETIDRSKIWTVQTPQTFKYELLLRAYQALKKASNVTDEASAVELLGEQVRLVPTMVPNIKITVPDDIMTATALLGMMR